MNSALRVFKFGGASIKDAERIKNVCSIIQQHGEGPLLVVISAMGKTTNTLEEVARSYARGGEETLALFEAVKQAHYAVISDLFGGDHEIFSLVNDLFVEVEWVLEEEPQDPYDYLYDQIVSIGELVSTRIVNAYLQEQGIKSEWLDARDVILTDNIFREGWVQWTETQQRAQQHVAPMLADGKMVITQGFIGSTSENFTTTLGREGSDYSAAIFSYCLDAESMTIWKDVPGVLTADPRKFENVTKLERLSYREAIEMTYYGAKVIHPKTIKPLQNKNIPLLVKSFIEPAGTGTTVSGEVEDNYPPMVAIESNQALVQIRTRDFSFVAEHHMSMLFKEIADLRLQVTMMQNTAISFSVCVYDQDDKVARFKERIEKDFQVTVEPGLELITVRHFQNEVLQRLREGKIVLMEERVRQTVQLVVKDVPVLERK